MSAVANLRWSLSLGRRILAVAAGRTLAGAACLVSSQLLLMAASFLPFKALILAVQEQRHFSLWPGQAIERGPLVLLLCLCAFACYGLHLLARRRFESGTEAGARELILHTGKMQLFDNQETTAAGGYRRFVQGLASLSLACACLLALAWLEPRLATGLLGYSLLLPALALWLGARSARWREHLDRHLPLTLEAAGGLGFLAGFAYLVLGYFDSHAELLFIVGMLILTRQYLRHALATLRNLVELLAQREPLSALFFQRQVVLGSPRSTDIWKLLEAEARHNWLTELLEHCLEPGHTLQSVQWQSTGTPDVIGLSLRLRRNGDARHLHLRLFEAHRAGWARHEATLLLSGITLPSVPFLGKRVLAERYHCHLFDVSGLQQAQGLDVGRGLLELRGQLLRLQPPAPLAATYTRSHPCLWQRLDPGMLERLHLALGDTPGAASLPAMARDFDSLRERLARLPLGLVHSGMGGGMLWQDEGGAVRLSSWERWGLDSLGSGWPVDERNLARLEQDMGLALAARDDLTEGLLPLARLAALLSAFETRFQRQDFGGALDLIQRAAELHRQLATPRTAREAR